MLLLLQAFEVRSDVCFPVSRRTKDLVAVRAGERPHTLNQSGKKIDVLENLYLENNFF